MSQHTKLFINTKINFNLTDSNTVFVINSINTIV